MSVYNKRQWEWAIERYKEGYQVERIAKFLGVHRHSVEWHIKKANCRRELPPLEDKMDEFLALASQNCTNL